tara:strand:+ start:220 stop:972 length:753 start_codon:yes stop_codon:yes gene_type:complete
MLAKRVITTLTFNEGVLFRTKLFEPDYRYTSNFVDTWSVDEIIILDISRIYNTNIKKKFLELVKKFSENCFVPLTVGGKIKNLKNVSDLMMMGADKISLNTSAIINPKLITEVSESYGTQAVVVSIDVRKNGKDYEVFSHNGSRPTGLNPEKWAKKCEELGAGEILITSIDRDGFLNGFDLELCKKIKCSVRLPVLALGGCGSWQHMADAFNKTDIDAVCTQNIFHFTEESIKSSKVFLDSKNINVRRMK